MNKRINQFYKISEKFLQSIPLYFNFLNFSRFEKEVKPQSNVKMDFYNSNKVLTHGHYKPISKSVNLEKLQLENRTDGK